MAHKDQLDFFSYFSKISSVIGPLRILEIGSLDINGTIRHLINQSNSVISYTGVDIGEGPGVDVVQEGHNYLRDKIGEFNVILSAECLEHNPYWHETIVQSISALQSPGVIIFSWATTGRKAHGTHQQSAESAPFVVEKWNSYYRNVSLKDLRNVRERKNLDLEAIFINFSHKDLYWVGVKTDNSDQLQRMTEVIYGYREMINDINMQFLQDYKYLIRKSLRSRTETLLMRIGPNLYSSKLGSFMRARSKNIFSRSLIIFPLLFIRKKKQINRNQFVFFKNHSLIFDKSE